jgi:hypothetical protein
MITSPKIGSYLSSLKDNGHCHSSTYGLIPAAAVGLAAAFHFGINAPLHLYLGNLTLFSFQILDFLVSTIEAASAMALVLSVAVYLAFRVGRPKIAGLIIWSVLFLVIGFQFALFSSSDIIDGKKITYSKLRIASEILAYVVGAILFVRSPTWLSRSTPVALAIFVTSNTGLAFSNSWHLIQDQVKDPKSQQAHFAEKEIASVTTPMLPFFGTDYSNLPNLDTYSKEKNVIIIMIDTLQSDLAEEAIRRNDDIFNTLDGFVFFRNASGLFPFTNFAVPALLSGEIYRTNEPIAEYYRRANQNRVERSLEQYGFASTYLGLWVRRAYVMGITEAQREEQSKLVAATAFRQFPTLLKAAYFGDSYDFLGNQVGEISRSGSSSLDLQILDRMARAMRADARAPQFKYVHLWGAHLPVSLDRSCNPIPLAQEREAFLGQVNCLFSTLERYLTALKAKGLYDVSQIFIVADHGTQNFKIEGSGSSEVIPDDVHSSSHPTILFKDFGVRGNLSFSANAVSSLDIRATILNRATNVPQFERDLTSAASAMPPKREFFYYSSAQDMLDGQVERLDKYIVGPDARRKEGWLRDTPDD